MANRSCRRAPVPAVPSEPAVHRWPHPIPQACVSAPAESTLYYIRCALSYQNELLSEIKTLLEELALSQKDGEK